VLHRAHLAQDSIDRRAHLWRARRCIPLFSEPPRYPQGSATGAHSKDGFGNYVGAYLRFVDGPEEGQGCVTIKRGCKSIHSLLASERAACRRASDASAQPLPWRSRLSAFIADYSPARRTAAFLALQPPPKPAHRRKSVWRQRRSAISRIAEDALPATPKLRGHVACGRHSYHGPSEL
jgi:hypothetical protein